LKPWEFFPPNGISGSVLRRTRAPLEDVMRTVFKGFCLGKFCEILSITKIKYLPGAYIIYFILLKISPMLMTQIFSAQTWNTLFQSSKNCFASDWTIFIIIVIGWLFLCFFFLSWREPQLSSSVLDFPAAYFNS